MCNFLEIVSGEICENRKGSRRRNFLLKITQSATIMVRGKEVSVLFI